ncbi:YDG domain-containing protein [Aquincola sp. MAHUQ-54]|uniref:YDG domain-containing protein n=1 Tax=Aquincola agrisoli TaxID=3119538 RepID=A0AAW9QE13_9BURK
MRSRFPTRPHPLAAALAMCLAGPAVQAQTLPSGLQTVNGKATVTTAGSQMTVTNTANAILNWRSFSIGADASVHFQQPGTTSQVLNRVTGNDPSSILGSLTSNGKVWLLNPHGVLFGAGARVDVASMVVSTLNLNDADFLAGRYRFGLESGLAGEGRIVNQGELRTASGGRVALLASAGVANEGLIQADGGQVMLAAGRQIELVDTHAPNLALRVTAPQGEALNLGRIIAPSGRIDVQAAIVNQQGVLRADALAAGPAGEIVLQAADGLTLAAGSRTSASGGTGGQLTLDAGRTGTALVAGTAEATGTEGAGGRVKLLGRHVGVLDGGVLDASGAAGGGQVLVGGGPQGRDASVPNAEAAYIAPGARLSADATGRGDGGRVIVWSDLATRAYGRFSARSGALGGDGGLVETSGGWLDARPAAVSVQAAAGGRAGTWLIDPFDITISDSASDIGVGTGPVFESTGASATLSTASIETALQQGNSVTITTGAGGAQAGDITLQSGSSIDVSLSAPVTLTLSAHRDIVISGGINATGAALDMNFNAAQAGSGSVQFLGASLSTAGSITATGSTSLADPQGSYGVYASGGQIAARAIQLNGTSVGGTNQAGVFLASTRLVATESLQITGTAQGTTNAGSPSLPTERVAGVRILNSRLEVQPSSPNTGAVMRITGTATMRGAASGSPIPEVAGVYVSTDSFGQLLAANGAALDIAGTVTSADVAYSVLLNGSDYGGDLVNADTGSAVTVRGTGSGGGSHRVELNGASLLAPAGGTLSIESNGDLLLTNNTLGSFSGSTTLGGVPASVVLQAGGSVIMTGDTRLALDDSSAAVRIESLNGAVTLADTSIRTGGAVQLLGSVVSLGDGVTVSSTATGDAIVVAGSGGGNLTGFLHLSEGPALEVSDGGRWLVYATTPDSSVFNSGTLDHAFRQYNATRGAGTVLGSGNGLLFSQAASLSFTGTPTKTYDGSTGIGLSAANLGVTGALSGDVVQVATGSGNFADAHAGTGKAITFDPALITVTGSDERPVYGYTLGPLTGTVTPRLISASAVTAANKVYDGNNLAAVTLAGAAGLVEGETLNYVLDGRFNDANAATGKLVTVGITLADGTAGAGTVAGRASDYQLSTPTATARADITPRPLSLTAAVASKLYDGSTGASVTLGGLDGLVAGEQLTFTTRASFGDANAGNGKSVLVGVTAANGAGGLASNYAVPASLVASGDILQRTLTYTADALTLPAGSALPALTGSVSGFIEGENLGNATSGTLRFTTPATTASPAGSYAIDGGGLVAANYRFEQAEGNAVALTLTPSQPPQDAATPAQQATPAELARTLSLLAPLSNLTMPLQDRALDATQALATGGGLRFRSVPVGSMSQDELAALLASRDRLKQAIFADALAQLAADPQAADVKPCETPEQAASGTCMITESQRDMLRNARAGSLTVADAPAPAASPAPPAAPAPAQAPAVAPPPAPVPPPTNAVAAPQAPLFPARASVRTAALPQIQRKLAVLIGTDRYQDTRIPQLDNAVSDARAVARMLETALGYETLVIEDGRKDTVLRTLNRLAVEAGPNDSIVIYYAGHGAVVQGTGEGYWQPSDADATKPQTWISNADIGRAVERLGATQVALISDSCYSGSLVSDARIRAATSALDPAQVLSRRTAVVMSSGGNEPVFDAGKDGHSTFAWNLMRTLQQVPTWQPGGNVFERVRFAVARELPQRPQYGAFSNSGYAAGADYLFEKRDIAR